MDFEEEAWVGQQSMSEFSNYYKLHFKKIEPFIGNRILEVGSGIGNMTRLFLDREFVVSIDLLEEHVNYINKAFNTYKNFKSFKCDIFDENSISLKNFKIDTIICINVLEHIENDTKALQNMYQILGDNGTLILLVPSFSWLYSTMDKAAHHYRRYNKKDLENKIIKSGFSIYKHFYFNAAGVPVYFLKGKILKKKQVLSETFSKKESLIYNRLVPVVLWSDFFLKYFAGLSQIIIAKKNIH